MAHLKPEMNQVGPHFCPQQYLLMGRSLKLPKEIIAFSHQIDSISASPPPSLLESHARIKNVSFYPSSTVPKITVTISANCYDWYKCWCFNILGLRLSRSEI